MSIPNVAHTSVVSGLRHGRFDYADEGLLDRTHLRFFTRTTACAMVEQAGFEIECVERTFSYPGRALQRNLLASWVKLRYRPERDAARLHAPGCTLLDSLTNQYLVLARSK